MTEAIMPDASSLFQDSLPVHPESLISQLNALNITFEQFTHPPLKTVDDSKEHRQNMLTKQTIKKITFWRLFKKTKM